jgi:hypothetical protein
MLQWSRSGASNDHSDRASDDIHQHRVQFHFQFREAIIDVTVDSTLGVVIAQRRSEPGPGGV